MLMDTRDLFCWQLITIKKTTEAQYPSPFDPLESPTVAEDAVRGNNHIPAHKDFREKYFKGFRRNGGEEEHEAEQIAPISDQGT